MTFQDTFNAQVQPAADRAFGVDALLIRANLQSDPFTAIWCDIDYQIADEETFVTKFEARDFEFAKGIVTILGETIDPRKGDLIEITENGATKQFEILPVGKGPAVETSPGGYRWKVHTKRN